MCCPSSPMADTPALMALKWTPRVSTPATPAIASMGNTRAPVCTGDHGVQDSQCAQVTQSLPLLQIHVVKVCHVFKPKMIERWVDSMIFPELYGTEAFF